jgi:hypothetical protein
MPLPDILQLLRKNHPSTLEWARSAPAAALLWAPYGPYKYITTISNGTHLCLHAEVHILTEDRDCLVRERIISASIK